MVETRRSSAAKRRRAPSEEASPPPPPPPASPASAAPVGPPSAPPPRSRSGKRAEVAVARAEESGTAGAAAVKPGAGPAAAAAVDVLDSSLDNLQGVARSAMDVATSSAVSNSGGRRKKSKPTRSFPTEEAALWKTLPASAGGRSEAWGRLISQSSEYPSIPIYPTHFTVGHGGKNDLKLTESSPGSPVCKLKHVKRGAALEIYVSKVVHVNGKALDKTAKVTLIGGDEVVFSSLGRHAYIFQQLPKEKSSTSSLCSTSVRQDGNAALVSRWAWVTFVIVV